MQSRALLGWLLVGAFCAAVSCGGNGGNGGYPKGFGLACESDKDCTGFSLLCGLDDKCVQCLDDDACKSAESCMTGLCKAPQACEDSRDCGSDLVCNETVGVCVQCLTTRDCPSDKKCSGQQCVDQKTCEFTSDCEDGLLCDADAGLCVSCRNDRDCPARRVCTDNECVTPGAGGTGGDGGTGASSGSGGSRAGSNNGGTNLGGSGGKGGSAGSSGSGNGAGVGPTDCDCLLGEVCTPDDRCVPQGLVDDLLDCDDAILSIEGRSGPWYATADTDIDFTVGYSSPGLDWADTSCAAWIKGGAVLDGMDTTFALLAAILNDGSTSDLTGYTGVQVVLESESAIQVVLKTTAGYYAYTLSGISGSNVRTVPFNLLAKEVGTTANLDLASVTEIHFTPVVTETFGYAVHRVELY